MGEGLAFSRCYLIKPEWMQNAILKNGNGKAKPCLNMEYSDLQQI